jgi:two-component system, cell cycle sensor histidine kinase and response regulator CckA
LVVNRNLFQFLSSPHPRIDGEERRRTGGLFAALTLLHFAVIAVAVVLVQLFTLRTSGRSIWGDLDFGVVVAGATTILVAYIVLRCGYLHAGIVLYLAASVGVPLAAPFMPNANAEIGLLATAFIPVILAATAFSNRVTALVLASITVAGALELALVPIPVERAGTGMAILIAVVASGILVLVFRAHLSGVERRRGDVLRSALEAARLSEQQYRHLFETITDGIFISDGSARILEVNNGACRQLGYSRAEMLGMSLELITPTTAPEIEVNMRKARADGLVLVETLHRRKDGELIPVELAISAVEYQGRPAFMGVSRDVSERIRVQGEQRRLEAALQQAAKMESIGRLAGGVAHDFNNLLTAILGNLELALGESPADASTAVLLRDARGAAKSAAELTGKLLAFSRKRVHESQPVRLDELVHGLSGTLRRIVGEDIRIEVDAAGNAPPILADPGLIEQVIVNLAANARDAMPDGGRLRFVIETALVRDVALANVPGVLSGDYVVLSIIDTGTGMSEEVKAHLFEPFFTTKELGRGTGLGLAISYGNVRLNGGHITVDTSPGNGTTFRLWFPRALVETAAHEEPRAADPPRGTETILLVDDAEEVRGISARMLRKLGYTVLTADSADRALELAASTPPPLHLVLTDIVMPGASGRDLVNRLAVVHPETRALLTSGYDQQTNERRGTGGDTPHFIPKPYSLPELARKVRAVLDGTGA